MKLFLFSSQELLTPTIQPAVRSVKVPNMVRIFTFSFPIDLSNQHLLVQSQKKTGKSVKYVQSKYTNFFL